MPIEEENNSQEKITFRCAQCGKRLSTLKSRMGTAFTCPYCGFSNTPGQNQGKQELPSAPPADNSVEPDDAVPARNTEAINQQPSSPPDEKKKENVVITYSLIVISLIFCAISLSMFIKTLDMKVGGNAVTSIEDLLVDKEAEQAIYTPVDIQGETIGLESEPDEESVKRLQNAASLISAKPKESDIQEINNLFTNFLKEKDLNKKLDFIFSQEEMKPLISKWEAANGPLSLKPEIVLAATHNAPFMLVRFSLGTIGFKDVVFVKDPASGKWKIDWPSLVGYSEYTGKELQANRPQTAFPARVILSMGDLYESPFLDIPNNSNYEGKSYLSIKVVFPDGSEFFGYVDRHTDLALELSKGLTAGAAQAIVELQFPSDPSIHRKNVVIIKKLIRDNWLSDKASELIKGNNSKP